MARTFTAASSEGLTVSSGAIPTPTAFSFAFMVKSSGAGTAMQLFRVNTSGGGGIFAGTTNFTSQVGIVNSASVVQASITFPTGPLWLVTASKPAGASLAAAGVYSFATNTWVRANTGSTVADPTTSGPANVTLGFHPASGQFLDGDMDLGAIWTRALSTDEFDRLPYSLQAWYASAPAAGWLLDQQNVSQKVTDWTGGGANQSAITGTSVSANSVPTFGYGHPVIVKTRQAPAVPTTLTVQPAGSLPAGGPVSLANITPPVVTGTPQGFAFTTSGTVVTYTGGGATGTNVLDTIEVNSDNTVDTPAGWTLEETYVQRQGSYIFTRPGGTTTVTIDLGGGISTSTSVIWVRVANTSGVDTGATGFAQVTNVRDVVTPSFTSGALAAATDLGLAFAALHDLDGAGPPTSPSWSSGYVQQASATDGGAVTGVYGNVAVKVPAGTAAESPSLSWTNSAGDRYMLYVAFLGAEAATSGDVLTAQPAGTTPSGSQVVFNAGTVLTVGPAGTLPAGAGVTLSAATAVAATPAGTNPAGAASTFTPGTTLTAGPAGTAPAGSPVGLVGGTVLTAAPAGTSPSGSGADITVGSASTLNTRSAGTTPGGSQVGFAGGTVFAAQPAGTLPSGGTSTFTLGVPGATTLTAGPAGTLPGTSLVQFAGGTILAATPAGAAPIGSRVGLDTGTNLSVTPAGTQPSGTGVTSMSGFALTSVAAATQPAGSAAAFVAGSLLDVVPGGTLPSGGDVTFTAREALVVVAAATTPTGARVVFTGSATTQRQPGILTPGSTRSAPTAGTLPYPRLTAGTLRGPTYASGG